jgi:hypothetical protein
VIGLMAARSIKDWGCGAADRRSAGFLIAAAAA